MAQRNEPAVRRTRGNGGRSVITVIAAWRMVGLQSAHVSAAALVSPISSSRAPSIGCAGFSGNVVRLLAGDAVSTSGDTRGGADGDGPLHDGLRPNGRAFLTGVRGNKFTSWDPDTGGARVSWPWPSDASAIVAVAPDGSTVAIGRTDGTVRILDQATGKEMAILDGHGDKIDHFVYAPDGRTIATANPGPVRLWEVASGKERATLPHGPKASPWVAFSPNGETLASVGGNPRMVRLWDVATGNEQNAFPVPASTMMVSLTVAPDGRTVALGERDGRIRLWDGLTGQEQATYQAGPQPMSLGFSPDGTTLAACYMGGAPRPLDLPQFIPYQLRQVVYPDPRGTTIFDLRTGEVRYQLPSCFWPTFSADGQTLYTYGLDADAIAVWDMPPRRGLPWSVPWVTAALGLALATAWWCMRPSARSTRGLFAALRGIAKEFALAMKRR
jgi:WD40 repeat protein